LTTELKREYTARDFNRFPGAIARAARKFGRVTVTWRGEESLVVMDSATARSLGPRTTPPSSLFNALELDAEVDESAWGEPDEATWFPQVPDPELNE
jgi:hypothetical protein